MIVLGLILTAVAAAFAIGVLLDNTATSTLSVFATRTSMPLVVVFILGAVTLAVLVIGIVLIRAGTAHSVRRRREMHDLRKESKQHQREERDVAADADRNNGHRDNGQRIDAHDAAAVTRPSDPGIDGVSPRRDSEETVDLRDRQSQHRR